MPASTCRCLLLPPPVAGPCRHYTGAATAVLTLLVLAGVRCARQGNTRARAPLLVVYAAQASDPPPALASPLLLSPPRLLSPSPSCCLFSLPLSPSLSHHLPLLLLLPLFSLLSLLSPLSFRKREREREGEREGERGRERDNPPPSLPLPLPLPSPSASPSPSAGGRGRAARGGCCRSPLLHAALDSPLPCLSLISLSPPRPLSLPARAAAAVCAL